MSGLRNLLSKEVLRALPKAELHTHLDGCLRPSTVLDLAKKDNVALPGCEAGKPPSLEELKSLLHPGGAASLVEFLRAYSYLTPVLQNTAALRRSVREAAEDYGADGVRYLELRFCPSLHLEKGCTNEEILRAVCEEGREVTKEALAEEKEGKPATLPIVRIIVSAIRNFPQKNSMELAELAVKLAKEEAEKFPVEERQVAGFDLAGDEAGFAMELFKDAFDYVRANSDLGITIHAGEAAGWDSVRQAKEVGKAARLGHGVNLIQNKELLEKLANNSGDDVTTIEVCISSNVLTNAVTSLEEHPVRQFQDAAAAGDHKGLRLVPCTDGGLGLIGKSVSDQYDIIQRDFGFSPAEVLRLACNGFASAFLPTELREPLVAKAREETLAVFKKAGIVVSESRDECDINSA